MGTVVELDAHRPGWRVQMCECRNCHHVHVGVLHPQCPNDDLECPRCHAMTCGLVLAAVVPLSPKPTH